MHRLFPLLLSAALAVSVHPAPSLPLSSPEVPLTVTAQEETVIDLPYALQNSVELYLFDGSDAFSFRTFLNAWPDKQAFLDTLPQIRGHAVTNWTVPEDPWPVYKISIRGSLEDYTAIYCGGVWADNRGNVLKTEADVPAFWTKFAKDPAPLEGDSAFPASRLLALRDGTWDPRFLRASDVKELLPDIPMTLKSEKGELTWAVTAEGHTLKPGKDYAYRVWQEAYGALPAGTYRLLLPLDTEQLPGSSPMEPYDYAGASFRLGENWTLLPERAGSHSN